MLRMVPPAVHHPQARLVLRETDTRWTVPHQAHIRSNAPSFIPPKNDPAIARSFSLWSIGESNPWPRQCECRALPTALMPRGNREALYHTPRVHATQAAAVLTPSGENQPPGKRTFHPWHAGVAAQALTPPISSARTRTRCHGPKCCPHRKERHVSQGWRRQWTTPAPPPGRSDGGRSCCGSTAAR